MPMTATPEVATGTLILVSNRDMIPWGVHPGDGIRLGAFFRTLPACRVVVRMGDRMLLADWHAPGITIHWRLADMAAAKPWDRNPGKEFEMVGILIGVIQGPRNEPHPLPTFVPGRRRMRGRRVFGRMLRYVGNWN